MFPAEPFVYKFESKSKNLVEGDPLVLDCRAKGYPTPNVTWYKDSAPVDLSDSRVSTDSFEGVPNATLRIEKLTFTDRADYTCVAINEFSFDPVESTELASNATILVRVKSK